MPRQKAPSTEDQPQDTLVGDQLKTSRSISLPVLLGTLTVLLIGAVSLYFWHGYQVRRGAATLLERATALELDADYSAAAAYIFRYTRLQPDDTEAQIKLAQVYGQSATGGSRANRAIDLYYQALAVADAQDERVQIGTRLTDLLVKQGRFLEAENQARELPADDFEAAKLLALALVGRYRTGAVTGKDLASVTAAMIKQLRRTMSMQPDPELAAILAELLRDNDPQLIIYPPQPPAEGEPVALTRVARAEEADRVMDELVERDPENAQTWLTRYRYRDLHSLPGKDEDLTRALEVGPDDLSVRLVAGQAALEAGVQLMQEQRLTQLPKRDTADASQDSAAGVAPEVLDAIAAQLESASLHFQRILDQIETGNETALLGVGRVAVLMGSPEEAIDTWQTALDGIDQDQTGGSLQTLALRWSLLELLLDRAEFDAAEKQIEVLRRDIARLDMQQDRHRFAPLKRSFNLMHARWLVGSMRYAQALPILQRVAVGQPTSEQEKSEHLQAFLLIGACHEQAGRPDLAAQAYESAANVASASEQIVLARLRAAAAWETAGAVDNAIADCRRALTLTPNPQGYLLLARNLYTKQQRLPAERRDWSEFLDSMARLQSWRESGEWSQAWRADLLQAQYELVRALENKDAEQSVDKVVAIVRDTESRHPDDAGLWEQLVILYQQLQKPDDADRALQQFRKLTTSATAGSLLHARLLLMRREYPAARQVLEEVLTDAVPDDRMTIEKLLVQVAVAEDKLDDAEQKLGDLARQHPDDLSIAKMRMQVALEKDDPEAVKSLEAELMGNASEETSWAQALKIQRLIGEATSADHPRLREAMDLVGRLETARPGWGTVYALRGQIEEKRGDRERAAAAYQRAIDLGDQRVAVYERLLAVLYELGRFREAGDYLDQIENFVPLSSTLSTVALSIAVQQDEKQRALDVARRSVERRPNDLMARVWYGQVLASDGRAEEAEPVLQEAVKMAPQDLRGWNALFNFYLRGKRTDKARETMDQMMAQAAIPDNQRSFVLAQAYEALGDDQQAEAAYRAAIDESPDSTAIRMRLVSFYTAAAREGNRENQAKAIEVLRQVVQRDRGNQRARQMLAALQASQGGEANWSAAIELLGDAAGDAAAITDRRLQGLLLYRRDGAENLAQARKIFEELIESPQAEVSDRLLLAKILEREGDLDGAQSHYARLAGRTPPNRQLLALYADFLLRKPDLQQAEIALQQLDKLAVEGFDAELLQLRARLLKAQGREAEIAGVVEPLAEKQLASLADDNVADKSQLMANVARVYSEVGLYQAAESWCRRRMAIDPQQFAALAICLAQQDRMGEAIDVCVEAAAKYPDSPIPAVVVAGVLVAGKATPEDAQRVEPVLKAAESRYADNPNVLFEISNARFVQDRLPESIQLLEKVVQLDPKHVVALNNLATMMSEQPELRQKAIEYIDRAIDIVGERPDLFDTKGTIYVYGNQPEKAVELLEFAVSSPSRDPRYQFHLAAAYFGVNRLDEARQTFQAALDAGLEDQILTQTDRQMMEEMQSLLQMGGSDGSNTSEG